MATRRGRSDSGRAAMNDDILFSEDKTELCLDEARRMLHISKRKCAALLRDGVLPCTSTGKKTRQYRILRSDVETLMKTPAFNAKAAKSPTSPEKYRARLEDLWYDDRTSSLPPTSKSSPVIRSHAFPP